MNSFTLVRTTVGLFCALYFVSLVDLIYFNKLDVINKLKANLKNKIDAPFSYSLLAIILGVLFYAGKYDTSAKWRKKYNGTFKIVLSTAIVSFFSKAGLFIFPAFAACLVWLSDSLF